MHSLRAFGGFLREFVFRSTTGSVKGIAIALVAVCLTLGVTAKPAHALVVEWDDDGQGMSGTDSFGHSWTFDEFNGRGTWDFPFSGVNTWAGPDTVTEIHITFDLPDGVTIDQGEFFVGSDTGEWGGDGTISPDGKTVWWVAPPGLELDPGEDFWAQVFFTGALPQGFVPFAAESTTDGTIPEPSTIALFAIALGGLGFMTRRRRVA
ncbi:MAG: PEP-CTERM sorting domain-containing protein [Pseudomonadota bacterium]